jgi:hypothetical protein
LGIKTTTPESAFDFAGDESNYMKINAQAWAFRIGSLQNGTQFIGVGVKKTAADNNYIATSANIGSVNHSILEMNYDGTIAFRQAPHQNDGTVLNSLLAPSFYIAPGTGNVGIGTAAPTGKLDVIASNATHASKFTQNGAGAGSFSVASPPPSAVRGETGATSGVVAGLVGNTSSPDGMGVLGQNLASGAGSGRSAGVRGITAITTTLGTGVWGEALQTDGDNVGVFGYSASGLGAGVQGWAASTTGDSNGVYGRSDSNAGTGVYGEATATSAASGTSYPVGVYGKLVSTVGAAGLFDTNSTGHILVGRAGSSPVNVFRVDSTGKGFFNGSTQVGGADFAESVAVKNAKSEYVPGDLIAIDTTGTRRFTKASAPYSTLVAGIYSTKPGVLASPHAIDDARIEAEEIPLAVVGIVPCKVSGENGPIKAGDLLVSSSREGYAMKGTDQKRMNGAVIGKALQDFKGSTGVIEVLVSLQ